MYSQGYGQREAADLLGDDPRLWETDTIGFAGSGGAVSAVQVKPIGKAGDSWEIPAQLVLIAKGFTGPEQSVLEAFSTSETVYPAGDAHLGSTLVATAMSDAIQVAQTIARKLATR